MRIDLANLIAAQSSRLAPVKPRPPEENFARELKPEAPPQSEAPKELPKEAKEPPPAPPERSAAPEHARKNEAPRSRPGSQIDIKV